MSSQPLILICGRLPTTFGDEVKDADFTGMRLIVSQRGSLMPKVLAGIGNAVMPSS